MAQREVKGWKVTEDKGVIRLTKGDQQVEATFNPKDEAAVALAYEHALAQAFVADTGNDLQGLPVVSQWAEIHAWAKE